MTVIESLFTTTQNEDGTYPWTLALLIGKFISDIERVLGPRNPEFTFVGVEIDKTPDATPRLWFPDSGIPIDDPENRSRHIAIRLTPKALESLEFARWQLAHECVHMIDPWNKRIDNSATNVLEEGIAAWYQNFAAPCSSALGLQSYEEAEAIVKPHIGELLKAVKRMRLERRVRIGEITYDTLLENCPSLEDETARRLCDRFRRDG